MHRHRLRRVLHIGDRDVFGPEVNAASKLGEDTAEAWDILVTDSVAKEVESMPDVTFDGIDVVPPGAAGASKASYRSHEPDFGGSVRLYRQTNGTSRMSLCLAISPATNAISDEPGLGRYA